MVLCCALVACAAAGTAAKTASRHAYPDRGILRWLDDRTEVALLGVNYYAPFSIDYHNLRAAGLDPEQVIRDDVTHFGRLGLNLIRLHCWDREISDRQGNLVDNDHLRLLDFLIAECKRRGIYALMTPIAWWGAPAPGGFSDLYPMPRMTTDPLAWEPQCRYLRQYLEHVNRYTGVAYKDEPAIVALELINEPQYPPETTEEQVTRYIDTLTAAVRETGCRKAVLYNPWGGRHAAAAASTLDGVTFGWYPTGLISGGMLKGNYLPAVADYPAMRDPLLAGMVKAVYEFDAADCPGSVMYPAMARAFRAGGVQVAAMFQYDAAPLAGTNVNWQTHHLNLLYTPGKALSLAIAAEVFRRVPRLARFGSWQRSLRFADFHIDYRRDLSELAAADTFIHSNNTSTLPPDPARLVRVWGCGSSPLVRWEGTGAWFLDRLSPGVWKLQIYPDAVMVGDPYTGAPGEKVRLIWAKHRLQVRLPDLGEDYSCTASRDGCRLPVVGRAVTLGPGEYLLARKGKQAPSWPRGVPYVSPPPVSPEPAVFLPLPQRWREGHDLVLEATVAAPEPLACTLHLQRPGKAEVTLRMRPAGPYRHRAKVPGGLLAAGKVEVYLTAQGDGRALRFPAAPDRSAYPLSLGPGMQSAASFVGGGQAAWLAGEGEGYLSLTAPGFGPPPDCSRVQWPVSPATSSGYQAVTVVVRGGPDTSALELALVQRDGRAYGAEIPLTAGWREVSVPLSDLRPLWGTPDGQIDPSLLSEVRVTFGAWLFPDRRERPHRVDVRAVRLQAAQATWHVEVEPRDAPIILAQPGMQRVTVEGHPAQVRRVPGMSPDRMALRIAVPEGFDPAPGCTHFRVAVPETAAQPAGSAWDARYLLLRARAGEPETRKVEIVVQEDDGTPWGTVVELTPGWREIKVPLAELQHFGHWGVGPARRGKPGDRPRPSHIRAVNVCFGAWLYGDHANRAHALEIEEVALGR